MTEEPLLPTNASPSAGEETPSAPPPEAPECPPIPSSAREEMPSPAPPEAPERPLLHPLLSVLIFLMIAGSVAGVVSLILLVGWLVFHPEVLRVRDPQQFYDELMRVAGGVTGLLMTAVSYVPVLAVLILWRRGIDRKSFLSLGLTWSRAAARQLLGGLATGVVAVGGLFGILVGMGDLQVRGWATGDYAPATVAFILLAYFLLFVVQGGIEEIVCRGYLLQTVMEVWKPWLAVTVISLFFGALHLFNPGMSVTGLVQNVLIGVVFSLAYLQTRSLWFPIGLHVAWNFTLGPIVSLPVSGLTTFRLLQVDMAGSPLMTGGRYGLEDSLLTTVLTGVGGAVGVLLLCLRKPASPPQGEGEEEVPAPDLNFAIAEGDAGEVLNDEQNSLSQRIDL